MFEIGSRNKYKISCGNQQQNLLVLNIIFLSILDGLPGDFIKSLEKVGTKSTLVVIVHNPSLFYTYSCIEIQIYK